MLAGAMTGVVASSPRVVLAGTIRSLLHQLNRQIGLVGVEVSRECRGNYESANDEHSTESSETEPSFRVLVLRQCHGANSLESAAHVKIVTALTYFASGSFQGHARAELSLDCEIDFPR